jgi:hypothetical protein
MLPKKPYRYIHRDPQASGSNISNNGSLFALQSEFFCCHIKPLKIYHGAQTPRWQLEEAESVPPIMKSWRDTGNTPCRQNH